MQEAWENEFLQSTGFGNKLTVPKSTPSSTGVKEQRFINQYNESIPPPPAELGIPGTVEGPGAFLSGQLPLKDSLSRTKFEKPYPQSNILLNTDGTYPIRPTEQKTWQAPGIGNVGPANESVPNPASQFIPGSKPTGGFKIKEGMTGAPAEDRDDNYKYASVAFAAVAVLGGFGFTMSRDNPQKEKGLVAVSGISTILAIAFLVVYLRSGGDGKGSEGPESLTGYMADGRKLLQKTGFSPPYYPQQRDQADEEIAPNPPDAMNNIGSRLRHQGTNPNKMEGPRANVGYRRSEPTPDGHPVLKANQLMRSPGNYNMDSGTFQEYMRRMNGEAPSQVVQSHPYYTFNAEWDHRPQIDDSSRFYGITDEPNQMHRKAIYRQPKLQQAGAKRMHLKDPPPGSVMPVGKTHPWMENDETQTGPAFFASAGEKLVAEVRGGHVKDMMHPRKGGPTIEILDDEVEVSAADKMKERLSLDSQAQDMVGHVDEDFLKPQEVMSDRKMRAKTGQFQQVPEREAFGVPDGSRPPRTVNLDKGRKMPPSIHESPEDDQPVNQGVPTKAEESSDMFLSAFLEKTTPDQGVIEEAMNSRRE